MVKPQHAQGQASDTPGSAGSNVLRYRGYISIQFDSNKMFLNVCISNGSQKYY